MVTNTSTALATTTSPKTLSSAPRLNSKLKELLLSGDSIVVGPKNCRELRAFVKNAPELPLAQPEDFERALSTLSLATSGKRLSAAEAKEQIKIHRKLNCDLTANDLARAVVKLGRTSTFMPTPAEIRKAALSFANKRAFALNRAKHLIWLHETRWEPPIDPADQVRPEDLAGLIAKIDEAFPTERTDMPPLS